MSDIYERGRCTRVGAHDWFFSDDTADLAAAQAVCAACEVRVDCLRLALERSVEWGVWGGVIFWDGQPYHRKRGRGRPRHADRGLPVEATWDELRRMVRSA